MSFVIEALKASSDGADTNQSMVEGHSSPDGAWEK